MKLSQSYIVAFAFAFSSILVPSLLPSSLANRLLQISAVAQTDQNPFDFDPRNLCSESLPEFCQQQRPTSPTQTAQDKLVEAYYLLQQGIQQSETSHYQEAIQSWQQALELSQDVEVRQSYPQDSRYGEAWALNNLATVYSYLSQDQQAIDYLQQALPIFREVNDRLGEAAALNNLGNTYIFLSDYEQALDYLQQALPLYQDVGDRNGEAKALTNLGLAYAELSQYQRAIDYYQQALPLLREVGDRNSEGLLLANIGRFYAAQNSPISAIEQLQKSVEVRESIRAGLQGLPAADQQAYTDSIADDYRLLAELLRQQNRNQAAQSILDLL